MIINDPRYRYTIVLGSVYPIYDSRWELCPSQLEFSFFFIIKAHFPNWVRRNRRSMPTKSKRRRKRKRRPELNTKSPKRPFRGSWRTTRRWHLPPDTSKKSHNKILFSCFLFFIPTEEDGDLLKRKTKITPYNLPRVIPASRTPEIQIDLKRLCLQPF